ncbi:N-glycosylase/DNA lyase [Methanococcus maripaludis]|uniref:N-glycosylase/DNA lyase n=1 Tax=Methanococcus maripaludis TaxID=39152 RepID=A0A8T4CSH3_METMI|nr:N-glycosylase/DNA lyase [Methanococcus maripaludis]MBM7410053.1 DNA-(apurinic or apyrimidinic site) lyase [Methanococcus maripaludis]MBP2219383.1 DNA-(apurinic or apyrimidinic site) lyase [Methanococcus maripaludis]
MRNLEKINELLEIFGHFDVNFAKYMEEKIDTQYFVLENLKNSMKNDEMFIKLVILNSIVSYQLCTTGELWWEEFSKYWSKHDANNENLGESYVNFLENSKGNKRLLNVKIKRIEKIIPFLENLNLLDFKTYYSDMGKLLENLSKYLNSKKNSKTVVFAVKMFGYASRIVFNEFFPYPMNIEIPKDSRIEKYTLKFTDENPIKFWNEVSKTTNIPPLHIDSIIWPVLGRNFDFKTCENKLDENFRYLLKLTEL